MTVRTAAIDAPASADWVTLDDLQADPFPVYARLRAEQPVAWVPAVNRYLVTSFDACHTIELDAETYSADEEGSLMKRSMGHSMLRKDDPEHARERASYGSSLRPKAIKETWQAIFQANAERYLADVLATGPGADLIGLFAAPYAADNLRAVMGFDNASQQDMQRWSQTMINGTGNYADDAEVWALSKRSSDEVDIAIDEMMPYFREHPNSSILSGLANMQDSLGIDAIRANMKMTIGGGLNEPRDVLGVALWALLQRPNQLEQVLDDPTLTPIVFDEAIRWIAPIGMYSRQTTREVELGGVLLPAGARLGVVIGSANRDEAEFEHAAEFDINRPRKPHLAFGGGAHYCAGAWVAKAQVAQIALPLLLERLPGLRFDPEAEARITGWVFRGLLNLPVAWNV
jgi:hypothetical protein